MDLIQSIIMALANTLGVDNTTVVVLLGVLISAANIVGKAIPDNATGVLGIVRKVAKLIGLYVPNKVEPGLDTANVSRAAANTVSDVRILAKGG